MDEKTEATEPKFKGMPAVGVRVSREVGEPASARLTWGDGVRKIDYEATAAHVDVTADDGRLVGRMFSLSYVALADGAPDPARPVTFCFNGGPGSSSVPINFGGIGPRRVQTAGLSHIPAGAALADNPATLLVDSDIVFLDALGTGWSVLAADADPAKVFGIDGDADAFARAICAWLDENGRWSSPLYLYGESYGTVRNAALMRLLGERAVKLTGVVMLSAIFDWAQVQPGADLYYLGMMPTFAATAQHFGKVGAGVDADEWFDAAMDFAEQTYAPALLAGDGLGDEREREVAGQLAAFIGLPAEHVRAKHLRVDLTDFRARLLADEGRVCGRLDMRFCSDAPSYVQTSTDWLAAEDAADDAVEAAWTSAFRSFCRETLGYRGAARYLASNYEAIGTAWNWTHAAPGTEEAAQAPNMALDVATALRRDPTIKLAIIGGRYDAATTFWNVRHDLSCQFLSPELKGRISWYRYGCGHMAYVDEPTLHAMGADMHEFYQKA